MTRGFRVGGTSYLIAVSLYAAVLVTGAFAQAGRGTISGRVTDVSGAVLRAARVAVDPGGQYAFTDDLGQYLISDLAAGEYKVTISYVGFFPVTNRVSVAAGQAAKLDGIMKV